ncbi:hypothetical protein [Rhabdothermincola sediminis]|uniref:hypothetical protein n=1 Tax=Rhabdothermincola sediminis TaxID=2751370 RepID=UPI001AA03693|nr:hypothetical protein [Rhabdothermincola sediminis]
MTVALLVDDATSVAGLFADVLRSRLDWQVLIARNLVEVNSLLDLGEEFQLALIDLSYPHEQHNGLDVLLAVATNNSATRLVVLTQGDDWVANLLADAWEAFPLATVISKSTPLDQQLAMLRQVEQEGWADPDPVLRPWLPSSRSPWRRADQYGRLVQHAGHAKLWTALLEVPTEPSYRELSLRTGLKLNTLKNYRSQLVSELTLHGLDDPSLRAMQEFARRCRPFLQPFLDAKLGFADADH